MIFDKKKLGEFIEPYDLRAKDSGKAYVLENIVGISSISKSFVTTKANLIGVEVDSYKVVPPGYFAYNPNTARMGDKVCIALNQENTDLLVSSIYPVFCVNDDIVLPEYLLLWFMRPEFDRWARFVSHGSAREVLDWERLCESEMPVPSIDEQRKIVKDYQVVAERILLLNKINSTLVEIAKQIYRNHFEGNEYELIPLKNFCSKIGSGATPRGGKETYSDTGISLIRSTNVYDYSFSYSELAHINDEQADALSNVVVNSYDVLFNITGVSIARCCIVPSDVLPARVNQHVMILRPYAGKYMSYYLLMALCDKSNKNLLLGIGQSGSTREAINKQEMESFKIACPSKEEIDAFGEKIDSCFKQIHDYMQEVRLLELIRSLLLTKISKGE